MADMADVEIATEAVAWEWWTPAGPVTGSVREGDPVPEEAADLLRGLGLTRKPTTTKEAD